MNQNGGGRVLILDDDPLQVAPEKLKDVGVWGTVLGGRIFEAPRA